MSDADIAAVASGDASLSAWDKALVRAADELVRSQELGNASWAALAERYSEEQRMEVVFLVGCEEDLLPLRFPYRLWALSH